MNTIDDLFVTSLKTKGYSVTKPRQIIFDLLDNKEPQSISELVRKSKSQIDRASVYRTLEVFEETEITQRVSNGWKYKVELSDKFQSHHHHLTCRNCGIVIPIEDDKLEDYIENIATGQGFKIVSHQLEIDGYCAKCSTTH
jgi:Fur family ferric uptake transcriptional regulator